MTPETFPLGEVETELAHLWPKLAHLGAKLAQVGAKLEFNGHRSQTTPPKMRKKRHNINLVSRGIFKRVS